MYNSQYYTCEQIDQRLLQGYVDDFNSQTGQSMTKAQFLAKLAEVFSPTFLSDYFTKTEINNIFDVILTNGFIYGGVATPNGTPNLGGDGSDNYQSQLFFIATQPGTYTNYGGVVIPNYGFYIILWDTDTWSFDTVSTYANIGYFECNTAAGTADKTVAASGYVLMVGGSIKVKMTNANSADNATLNINSTGAKPLFYGGERASNANSWDEGEVVEIYYDGTSYYANNVRGGSGSGVYDVSVEHPTAGPNGNGKFTIDYILNPSNVDELIPVNKRYPGMSIQFVSISENNYVQYRLLTTAWSANPYFWERYNDVTTSNQQGSDLDISDERGNTLVRFQDGGIKTKNFDSSAIEKENLNETLQDELEQLSTDDVENVDLNISDEDGNTLVRFSDGHIKTKNFDSSKDASEEERGLMSDVDKIKLNSIEEGAEANDVVADNTVSSDLNISDEDGNTLVRFSDGHIKTKNFDSKQYKNNIHNKRISIIGDSISSYDGWVPKNGVNGYAYATYNAYYPRETVTSVTQTWWYKVITDLSLIIGQNCSWSGSFTKGDGEAVDTAYAGCSDRRIADLALNGTPDIIVIYMGTNDFTTRDNNVPIGNLTSKDHLPENGVKNTFSEAYGLMLSKVMQLYPLAQVFCCSLLDTNNQYRDTDGVYPTQNQHGVYLEDYNAKIKELALGYGAHFVDLNNCGITWFNLSQMMVDGSLHPNEQGHTLIANMVKKEILKYI